MTSCGNMDGVKLKGIVYKCISCDHKIRAKEYAALKPIYVITSSEGYVEISNAQRKNYPNRNWSIRRCPKCGGLDGWWKIHR